VLNRRRGRLRVASRWLAPASQHEGEQLRGKAWSSGGWRAAGGKVEVAARDNRETRRR
jgi:hypothetical protein